jgi:hypothetical protein
MAIDNAGDLFIADTNNFRIREVAASSGTITTVAGNGTLGNAGNGGPATSAEFGYVYQGIAVNGAGTVVTIGDDYYDVIRQFTVRGNIGIVAGNGSASFCGDGGPATSACINSPRGIAIAKSGLIYFADYSNNRVRAFTVGGNINTVAGNGSITFPTLVSGVPPSGVVLNQPNDVLEDPSGNIFVPEYANCMVRELVKSSGLVKIFAGSAAAGATTGTCGYNGAGGPATSAVLGNLGDVARDSAGNIYIADETNCVIWQVSAATRNIAVFAGTAKSCGYGGDGGPATSANLYTPSGLAVDSRNNLYIAEYNNNRIREVSGGTITTIAGNGFAGYVGDGDPATIAELNHPAGVAVDSARNVYVADYDNCVVREVTAATGIISTVAGTGQCGFNGDGMATGHDLYTPTRVHVDANQNLFISEDNNQRVRWVNPAGIMTTIAGSGAVGFSGDGGPATSADFYYPRSAAQDASGNYLIADLNNLRVRRVSAFPALYTSASSLSFGLVTVGSNSTPQVLDLSALGVLTFSNISITGPFTEYDNCGSGLSNEATCKMIVTYKPTAAGTQTGAITFEDNGFFSDSITISLEGTGSAFTVTGGPLSFGNQAVKTASAPKKVTVANKGTAAVTMGTIALNDTTDFSISANTCPASGSTLAAGASCTISVVFKPKSTGNLKAALIINDSDPSSPQVVGLTGTGTSLVVFNPSSVTFAPQAVGTTSGLTKVTLSNNTGTTLTLKKPALTITGPFSSVAATTCTNGLAIAAGGNCVIYLEFTPTAVGFPTGTLSVADSDSTSPQTVPLSGTGTGVEYTPSSVNLSATVGQQVSTSVTISNVGTSSIAFSAWTITGANSKDFSANLADPPCLGSLASGAICTFTVYFKPSLAGSETANLLVYDNSTGSPQVLPLNGTGQ